MKIPLKRPVLIFYAGDDPQDSVFAQRIADSIGSFCAPQLINVDETERQDLAFRQRSERYLGVPIYVVSDAMLQLPHRPKLEKATPRRNLPGRSVFYICRGVTVAEIKDTYPDLRKLFDDVMVGEEADMPVLLQELKEYLEHTPDQVGLGRRLLLLAQFLAVNLMYLVGAAGYYAYFAAFLTVVWLLWSLLLTGGDSGMETAAACHALYATGYAINRVRPLDLWPRMGPAWAIGERAPGGHSDSNRTLAAFLDAIGPWQRTAEAARRIQFLVLCLLAIPGLAALAGVRRPWWYGSAAFVLGLTMPRLSSAAMRSLKRWAYWDLGMTEEEMKRTARSLSKYGVENSSAYEYRYLEVRGGRLLHRPWLRKRPRVFISYARRDEALTPAASILEHTISKLGFSCFLDKRRIPSPFASWRSVVVDEILDCTHCFVVLGPNVLEAKVVHREIRTALQRWYTELEPAMICVVEPDVVAALEGEELSNELNYLLREAPKITYAEAARSEVVGWLLGQRRRQGLLQDWLALLRPAERLQRFLSSESFGG